MSTVQDKYNLFINNSLVINQNTNPYGNFIIEGTYDYTFIINLSSTSVNNDITRIFNNASFIQSSVNADLYNVNLAIDRSDTYNLWSTTINNVNLVTVGIGNSNVAFGTLNPNNIERIGDRLLEVVAHKLFGHGQARAAISNDLEFYTHDATIWDHLSNSLGNNTFANSIFNQYVASNRYAEEANRLSNNNSTANDVTNWVNFNFFGFTFDYPLNLYGNVIYDPSIPPNELALLKNGPSVGNVNSTSLVDGVYNIPILVRFTC
jgi:hypothetical protein